VYVCNVYVVADVVDVDVCVLICCYCVVCVMYLVCVVLCVYICIQVNDRVGRELYIVVLQTQLRQLLVCCCCC